MVLQKQNLNNALLKEGDITQDQYSTFHKGAQCYLRDALAYIQEEFPITNEVICNSVWIDVVKRHGTNWNNVEYFLEKFSRVSFMEEVDRDELFEEFIDYQSLTDNDIAPIAWKDAEVVVVDSNKQRSVHFRVDVLWHYLSPIKIDVTSLTCFKLLPGIASIVLVIPHSNADQECLFSIVHKNKTDSRWNFIQYCFNENSLSRSHNSLLQMET